MHPTALNQIFPSRFSPVTSNAPRRSPELTFPELRSASPRACATSPAVTLAPSAVLKTVARSDAANAAAAEIYSAAARVLLERESAGIAPKQVIVFTDVFHDVDDLAALCLLKELDRLGLIRLSAVIANRKPADKRACLLRSALDVLGAEHVAVGAGSDGCDDDLKTIPYEFAARYTPASAAQREGQALLREQLEAAPNKSVNVLLISSQRDIAQFLVTSQAHRDLFCRKVASVVMQGGIQATEDGHHARRAHGTDFLLPNGSTNNTWDVPATEAVFTFLQQNAIPMEIATTAASRACHIPAQYLSELAARTGHPVAEHLRGQLDGAYRFFYNSSLHPETQFKGRDTQHFMRSFTNWYDSHPASSLPASEDEAMQYVKHVHLFDALAAVMVAGADLVDAFGCFDVHHENSGGVDQRIVGLSDNQHGIREERTRNVLLALIEGAMKRHAVSNAPNKFGDRLQDASNLPHEQVKAVLEAARDSGDVRRTFLIPADYPMPVGFRLLATGRDIRVRGDQLPRPSQLHGSVAAARLVVLDASRIPHIQDGKKGAGHIALTVELTVPSSLAAVLRERRGTPIQQAAFLALANDTQEPHEVVTVAVCGLNGKVATKDAYANSYSNFGGSADITAAGVLETGEQAIRREVQEEAGAAIELLGNVRASTVQMTTQVDVGGPYFIEVADTYTSAVSTRTMSLEAFRDVLGRTRPDAREIKEIAVYCLPNATSVQQAGDKAGFEKYLREEWFAPPTQAPDTAAQEKANKATARLVGLTSKIFASRGAFGPGYPEVW